MNKTAKKMAPLLLAAIVPLVACSVPEETNDTSTVERLVPEIVATHAFDATSFTQGLEVMDGDLLIGTGQYGDSRIYRSTIDGEQSQSQELEPQYFGEGLTRVGNTVWQLTWKAGMAFKRDAQTLEEIDRVSYDGEGWGACAFEDFLITSDGSSTLTKRDPDTFAEIEEINVTLDGAEVPGLNELECVDGQVYANIFLDTDIVRIQSDTGEVTAVIDASHLPNNATPDPDHVLNGIAHIPGTDRFYLSGKRWPDLYEVRFVPSD